MKKKNSDYLKIKTESGFYNIDKKQVVCFDHMSTYYSSTITIGIGLINGDRLSLHFQIDESEKITKLLNELNDSVYGFYERIKKE